MPSTLFSAIVRAEFYRNIACSLLAFEFRTLSDLSFFTILTLLKRLQKLLLSKCQIMFQRILLSSFLYFANKNGKKEHSVPKIHFFPKKEKKKKKGNKIKRNGKKEKFKLVNFFLINWIEHLIFWTKLNFLT